MVFFICGAIGNSLRRCISVGDPGESFAQRTIVRGERLRLAEHVNKPGATMAGPLHDFALDGLRAVADCGEPIALRRRQPRTKDYPCRQ